MYNQTNILTQSFIVDNQVITLHNYITWNLSQNILPREGGDGYLVFVSLTGGVLLIFL